MSYDLSLGTQTFESLIKGRFIYVDKTHYIYEMVRPEKAAYFFSRPRRFGKSLTVTTLESIFLGKKELFEGLAIAQTDYAWPVYPVIRFDMKEATYSVKTDMLLALDHLLQKIADAHGITIPKNIPTEAKFMDLIELLYKKTGQKVVILIDEYDKPLIDNLHNIEEAKKIQNFLKGFYGVLKSADEYLRFVFITGVSKFSKVSVFSDLNHLTDLTMRSEFATLVGMTESELLTNYGDYVDALALSQKTNRAGILGKIRHWYNGYRFSKEDVRVYNPWSTLSLFQSQDFLEHWYSTGIPKMLVDIINRDPDGFSQIDPADFDGVPDCRISQIETYDIDKLQLMPLMFQTGFLTIKNYDVHRNTYVLGYPNWEVRGAFVTMLLETRLKSVNYRLPHVVALDIYDMVKAGNMEGLIKQLTILIASIPGNLHTPKESYYHSLIHMVFQTSGLMIRSEEWVSGGRIDTVIEEPDRIYIIEFKFDGTAAQAVSQIQTRGYAEKYRDKPVYALGVGVACETKSIADWELVQL